jgi:hypothetical protein
MPPCAAGNALLRIKALPRPPLLLLLLPGLLLYLMLPAAAADLAAVLPLPAANPLPCCCCCCWGGCCSCFVHSYSGGLPSIVHTSCSSDTTLRCPSWPSVTDALLTRCNSCHAIGCTAGSTSANASALAPAGGAAFSFVTSSSMLYPIAAACAATAACTAAAASAGVLGF